MLSPNPPEKAVTTHPAVVAAAAVIVKSAGAIPAIGDSPSFYAFSRVAEESGIREAAVETGTPLVSFDEEVEIDTPQGCRMRKLVVARAATRADAVISLPKFKTHNLTCVTAAIKNTFGCIPGLKKAEMHLRFSTIERFSRMLAEIVLSLPSRLYILDAVIGMDGNGPGAGDPFRLNLIIAGMDAVAVDSTACRVVGIDPMKLPMIRAAEECGVGNAAEDNIEITGEPLADVRVPGFRYTPPGLGAGNLFPIPEFAARRFKSWFLLRPRFLHGVCTRCGSCIAMCPARPKALSMKDGRVAIDDRACIRCYCCSEICTSRAVILRRGPAAGALARLLGL
jgi:uncharacterized protein (DUF362 family)/Pyruvate/2-oxoacid:ferredoxin oxidoreductase delta subunit